jgi:Cdc6-like AAA superfamily ATPase
MENDKNDKKDIINVDKVVKQNIEVKLEPNIDKKINNEIIVDAKKEEQKIIEDIEIKDCSREESNIISLNNVSESSHHRISLGKPSKSKSQSKSEKSIASNTENKEKEDDDEEEEEVIPPPKPTDFLPCREKEQEIIYKYIKTGLYTKGNYSSLYISGMPGTGKTDSVNRVIEILEKQYEKTSKKKKKFQTIYINGIDYLLPKKVFKSIYDKIFSKKKKILAIIKSLDEFFKNRNFFNSSPYLKDPTNSHIILVLDEVDLLIDKSQTLLYNIFNWTTYPQSKLIVLSISNTLDLPNRLLTKVQSRMGNNKIMFKPYTKDELHKIILSRGIDINTYSEDALKLSSMKVAAVNGDLRRIIQILNKSKEIYEQEKKDFPNASNQDLITKYHILKACEELFDSKITKVLRMLQVSEKIILAALLTKIKDNNESKINVGEIFEKKDKFLEKYNENCSLELSISWNEFQRIIYNLLRLKIISFIDGQRDNFIDNYVIIKFYSDEFMAACDGNESMKPVIDLINNLMGNYNSN